MPCYSPLHGYEGKIGESGKACTVWRLRDSTEGVKRVLPCGQCVGCRLERSRQWAMRCVYEASLWDRNCFITLTYNDENLPFNSSLVDGEFSDFMKRLRKSEGSGIRFFHAGEYGECCRNCGSSRVYCRCDRFVVGLGRPHYHALIFNYSFGDREFFRFSPSGQRLYRSKTLEKFWNKGYSSVADVSFDSAAYVARYCVKKKTGKQAKEFYGDRKPEYATMSRRPGIGKGWYDKFKSEVFPSDFLVVNGRRVKPPRFFDFLLDKEDPDLLESVKFRRKTDSRYETDQRLLEREEVKVAQIGSLKRGIENV